MALIWCCALIVNREISVLLAYYFIFLSMTFILGSCLLELIYFDVAYIRA